MLRHTLEHRPCVEGDALLIRRAPGVTRRLLPSDFGFCSFPLLLGGCLSFLPALALLVLLIVSTGTGTVLRRRPGQMCRSKISKKRSGKSEPEFELVVRLTSGSLHSVHSDWCVHCLLDWGLGTPGSARCQHLHEWAKQLLLVWPFLHALSMLSWL